MYSKMHTRPNRRIVWIVLTSLSCIAMLPSIPISLVRTESPVLIGVCLPLSGSIGARGCSMLEGIMAAKGLRSHVLERPVELRVVDTTSRHAEAEHGLFRLVEKDRVTAVIGDFSSGNALASSLCGHSRDIPLVSLGRPVQKGLIGTTGTLNPSRTLEQQGVQAARFAVETLSARTAAILSDVSDEESRAPAAAFQREFANCGGRLVLHNRVKTGDRDFLAQVNLMIAAKPDMIYAPLHCVDCALFARQAREMGLNVPIMAGEAAHFPELVEFGGRHVEGLMFTTSVHANMMQTELGRQFRESSMKRAGRMIGPAHVMGAESYFRTLEAIANAGSLEPASVRAALSGLKTFDGLTGRVPTEEQSESPRAFVVSMVRGGRFIEPGNAFEYAHANGVHGTPGMRSRTGPDNSAQAYSR